MNYSNYRFTLDTQSNISQVSLPVRLLDTSRRLYISLTDGGSPYIIEDGCRAVFYARKADGNPIMNDCIIEKNTQIRYDLTQQTTACAGVVDCEVRLYGTDGKLITSPRFIMVVDERVVYDEDFPLSDAEQTVLDNIILSETARANAEELRVAAEELRVSAESERSKIHDEMLDSIENAKEISDALEQKIAEGDYKGDTGDSGPMGPTGNSGVYIGSEVPTDPEVNVWVDPTGEEYDFDVVQTTGDSESFVMSQKATTECLSALDERVNKIELSTTHIDLESSIANAVESACIDKNGVAILSGIWAVSDYITICKDTRISFALYGTSNISSVAFYNKEKTFIGGVVANDSWLFKQENIAPPEDAYYMRYCALTNGNFPDQYISFVSDRIGVLERKVEVLTSML